MSYANYGSNRNSGLMRISSYAEAKRMLEETKKIRGRADDQIPLGRRDKVDQFRINLDPKTLDVLLICHRTNVVTWHPDDSITVKTDNWNTQTTAYFISEVTGMGTRIFNHNMCVSARGGEYVVPTTGLRFVRAEGVWGPVNPEQRTVHKLDRKAYNNVRSRYAEFEKYYMGMAKLRDGNTVPAEEVGDDKDAGMHLNPLNVEFANSVPELINLMHDANPETQFLSWQQVFHKLLVVEGSVSYDWSNNLKAARVGWQVKAEAMADVLQRYLVGIHRDEVLVMALVPKGKVRKDAYALYFNNGWDTFHENAS
jgi:hypothetical protein